MLLLLYYTHERNTNRGFVREKEKWEKKNLEQLREKIFERREEVVKACNLCNLGLLFVSGTTLQAGRRTFWSEPG